MHGTKIDGHPSTEPQSIARPQQCCKLCWMLAPTPMRGLELKGLDPNPSTWLRSTARSRQWCRPCWMLALTPMPRMKLDGRLWTSFPMILP